MGTSSARKAPVGKFWRTAKTAVSRFASGKESSPPQVQEVVARYLAALKSDANYDNEGSKNFLPVIIEAAASLGNFYRHWEQTGWEAALESLKLNPANAPNRGDIIPALLDKLIGPGISWQRQWPGPPSSIICNLSCRFMKSFPRLKNSQI